MAFLISQSFKHGSSTAISRPRKGRRFPPKSIWANLRITCFRPRRGRRFPWKRPRSSVHFRPRKGRGFPQHSKQCRLPIVSCLALFPHTQYTAARFKMQGFLANSIRPFSFSFSCSRTTSLRCRSRQECGCMGTWEMENSRGPAERQCGRQREDGGIREDFRTFPENVCWQTAGRAFAGEKGIGEMHILP